MLEFEFPDGFMWGTATAAHQVEGNNVYNDVWLLEHIEGSPFAEPSGDACDHYHRYPKDIALLSDLGLNTYRFSLEWSRIEPEEAKFSGAALAHYRRMLISCHEHGLTPMLTFHHFSSPRWLAAAGGWESDETPARFARFCGRATQALGDLIGAACTLNEPNIAWLIANATNMPPLEQLRGAPWWTAAAKVLGIPPERFAPFIYVTSQKARETMIAAHHMAVDAIKSGPGDFPVGMTIAVQDIQAGEGGEAYAAGVRRQVNDVFLEAARRDDFVGVQSYSRQRFGPDGPLPPEEGMEVTQMGYEFWPEALEASIRYAIARAGVPVIVTENGIATADDTRRVAYVRRALAGVANCLRDGLDVRGYIYWSAFDNFEWNLGYAPTFGIIGVDRQTQRRSVKPSARWLGEIARANRLQP
jgi:beta-glucosidase